MSSATTDRTARGMSSSGWMSTAHRRSSLSGPLLLCRSVAARRDGSPYGPHGERARDVWRRSCGCIEEQQWAPDAGDARAAYRVLSWFLAPLQAPAGGAAADAIICFGSRDLHVPITAAELFHRGVAPVIVCTGGVELVNGRTEADVFASELLGRGVPSGRIVTECESTHTGDNVTFGMRALQESVTARRVRSVIAVTWPFVARRCLATFALRHPEVVVRSVPGFCRPAEPAPFTRVTARWSVDQLERIVDYAGRGEIAPVPIPLAVSAAASYLRDVLLSDAESAYVDGMLEPVGERG